MGSSEIEINHELVQDCLKRISSGDAEAAFELAQLYMSRMDENDVDVMLWLIEGLARQSAALGSNDAQDFLTNQWEALREPLRRRLLRKFGRS